MTAMLCNEQPVVQWVNRMAVPSPPPSVEILWRIQLLEERPWLVERPLPQLSILHQTSEMISITVQKS
jgi:hypothetical protein